jgi:hypothetical protein
MRVVRHGRVVEQVAKERVGGVEEAASFDLDDPAVQAGLAQLREHAVAAKEVQVQPSVRSAAEPETLQTAGGHQPWARSVKRL